MHRLVFFFSYFLFFFWKYHTVIVFSIQYKYYIQIVVDDISVAGLWIRSISKENDICANSLEKINCDGLCHTFATKLVINRIQNHEAFCQQCSNSDVKKYVGTLCKDTRCASPQNNNNCLFHQRFVKVEYSCEGNVHTFWNSENAYQIWI